MFANLQLIGQVQPYVIDTARLSIESSMAVGFRDFESEVAGYRRSDDEVVVLINLVGGLNECGVEFSRWWRRASRPANDRCP
jgi:hypothetical protein